MRRSIHRPALAGIILAAGLGTADGAQVTTFSGITSWVGSGPNSAALVIDWNNAAGPSDTSLVWGYHWTGSATGEQMLDAIVAADPHLYLYMLQTNEYGDAPAGIGFDSAADENFPLSPALTFTDRVATTTDSGQIDDSRSAVNAGDLWEEGWNSGYWAYWISTSSDLADDGFADWSYSDYGITYQPLSDGDWDALTFAPGFDASTPAEPEPAVVPEPAAISLLLMGSLCLLRRPSRSDRAALR